MNFSDILDAVGCSLENYRIFLYRLGQADGCVRKSNPFIYKHISCSHHHLVYLFDCTRAWPSPEKAESRSQRVQEG